MKALLAYHGQQWKSIYIDLLEYRRTYLIRDLSIYTRPDCSYIWMPNSFYKDFIEG